MASPNVCWGIEAGAGAIKAVKIAIENERLKLLDYVVVPHAKTLSTPGLDQDDAMRVALGTFTSQTDLTGARVAVSVPGHSAFARFAKLPPVEPKKVPDIVKFEAVQQIPFPLEEVEWDFQTFQAPDSPDIEVGIFAMTKTKVNQILGTLADVRINPDAVTLSPLAAFNALAYDLEFTERTPGTIILDIGTTSSDLIIAEAGRVWIRTFGLGGHHFTDALVNHFKLSYQKAERLKEEAEQGPHAKHVFQAMRGVFTDLVQEINRSIGYYTTLHRDASLTRIIGLGSTFMLPGLRKFLKQQLSMDVFRLEEFKRLEIPAERKDDFFAKATNFVTAYGLALQGLGCQTIDANLVPMERVRDVMWKRKVPWFGIAAGVGLAASAAMFYRPFTDGAKVKSMRAPQEVSATISEASKLKAKASEANVIGGLTPDYSALNAIAMAKHVPYHEFVARDISDMLADAEGKVGQVPVSAGSAPHSGPAFMLTEVTTDYVPPQSSAFEYRVAATKRGNAGGGGGRAGGQGSGERENRGGGSSGGFGGDGAGAPTDEKGLDKGRIVVQMDLRTTHPDPRRLVTSTLLPWLRDNAVRAGVPYEVVANASDIFVTVDIVEPKPAELASGQPGVEGAPVQPRVYINERGEEEVDMEEYLRNLDPTKFQITGGSSQGSRGGGAGSGEALNGTLEAEAPLVPPPDQVLPEEASKLRLFFYVVLGEPAKSEGESGGEN
ncbi:MAG: type IV pilus assembly protein PilM [Phycisphaerales bacterium]|nr:type IV pilus assembly protein PilM [Phycisphaerales bacterium]